MARYECGRCGTTLTGVPFRLTCPSCNELLIAARRVDEGEE